MQGGQKILAPFQLLAARLSQHLRSPEFSCQFLHLSETTNNVLIQPRRTKDYIKYYM